MNLILIKKGYPVAIIKNKNRRKYLAALNQADKGNIYPFLTLTAVSLINTENIIVEELRPRSSAFCESTGTTNYAALFM